MTIAPGSSLLMSSVTGAPATLARADGCQDAMNGTAAASAPAPPTTAVVAVRKRRRPVLTPWLAIRLSTYVSTNQDATAVPWRISGPDAATGLAIVTATDATGAPIPTFPRSYPFTILAGASQSWTEGFSINFATTITWTATATAEFDVNPGNNTVTATTRVTGKGG